MGFSSFSTLVDEQNSLVIDVTYSCNANCMYCQWNVKCPENLHEPMANVYIDKKTLDSLGTERVVFSGGEPLLRNDLEELVSYYSDANVDSIVVISNGLILTSERLESLMNVGLTGVTVSLDRISYGGDIHPKGLTLKQHSKVIENFIHVLDSKKTNKFEVGINTVISRANLNHGVLDELIDFCNSSCVDWIKFNPVFDDGFLSTNAPWLKLRSDDSRSVIELGDRVVSNCKIKTNPFSFWEVMASILDGKSLSGSSCGLDERQAISIRGEIKFCFWMEDPIYGLTDSVLNKNDVAVARAMFRKAKESCKTGMHCFCLQKFEQKWELLA